MCHAAISPFSTLISLPVTSCTSLAPSHLPWRYNVSSTLVGNLGLLVALQVFEVYSPTSTLRFIARASSLQLRKTCSVEISRRQPEDKLGTIQIWKSCKLFPAKDTTSPVTSDANIPKWRAKQLVRCTRSVCGSKYYIAVFRVHRSWRTSLVQQLLLSPGK